MRGTVADRQRGGDSEIREGSMAKPHGDRGRGGAMREIDSYDVVFAGLGLANALAALRVAQTRPEISMAGFDAAAGAGAGRTWSFFTTDVTPEQGAWLRPLLRSEWPGYEVRFPGLTRVVSTPYATISAAALDDALGRALGPAFHRGAHIRDLSPRAITLGDGATVRAGTVIDGRRPGTPPRRAAWIAPSGPDGRVCAAARWVQVHLPAPVWAGPAADRGYPL
jgi:lycopene beta-cyclase